jgi:ATP adenylyltransferase
MTLIKHSIMVLKQLFRPEGFNIGMNLGRSAGAGIEEHLHFHIVPRWNGDTNFMPVLGTVKVLPEYLIQTYDKLYPLLQNISTERVRSEE